MKLRELKLLSHYGSIPLLVVALLFLGSVGCSGCGDMRPAGLDDKGAKVIISGYVRDSAGNGLPGFVVAGTDLSQSAVSNANGYFELRVPKSWSGEVELHRACYVFNPNSLHFNDVESNKTDNNFVATLVEPEGGSGPIARAGADQILVDDDGDGKATVQLNGTASTGGAAPISAFAWIENDVVLAETASVTIELPLGTHMITLRVRDAQGNTSEDQTAVGVVAFMQARSIFVDINSSGASDQNSGIESEPLRSIQAAAEMARPGDTVYIKAGTYIRNHPSSNARVVQMQNIHGAPDRPITFTNHNGGTVLIVGDFPGGNMGASGWEIIDCSWLNIQGIEFARFAGTGLDISAKTVGGTHHINVENCIAHECSQGFHTFVEGLRAIGPVRYVNFKNCMVFNSNSGIILREDPIQERSTCFSPPRAGNDAPGTPPCGYTKDMPEAEWDGWEGWTEIAPRYCNIESCIAFNNSHVAENSDGFGMRYAIDCVIRDNISFRNGDDNFDMLGATRLQLFNNIAFEANPLKSGDGDGNGIKVGVRGSLDCVVAYNISFNNYRMGIDMGDSERGRVYHNTLVHNGEGHANGWGLWFEGPRSSKGHHVVNNIFKDNGIDTSRGDFGAERDVRFALVRSNCISDDNDSNFAGPLGPDNHTNCNPRFANESMAIDTNFPAGLTIPQRIEFIRSQVRQKFGLASNSSLIDKAYRLDNINDSFQGAGPDIGAVESH